MQDILLNYPNLRVVEASVEDIILSETEKVQGIKVQDGKQHIILSHKNDELWFLKLVIELVFHQHSCNLILDAFLFL